MSEQFMNLPKRSGLARFFSKGTAALLEIIRDRVRREGRITFDEFMQSALYHPEFGYYNASRERIGKEGDFVTGPETHPIFGALIARYLDHMWRRLGQPTPFDVAEMGAGNGSLCRDLLRHARSAYPDFFSTIRYRIVESSPDAISKQKALLHTSHIQLRSIHWYPSLSELPGRAAVGCFLSNELVDAFPVHRVMRNEEGLKEVYVGLEGDDFVDVIGELSTPAIVEYFEWVGVQLPIGCQGEVNLRAVGWMKEIGSRLKKGFVLTFDYGYPAQDLYSPDHARGTLLCYYKQTYIEDPYVRVGQQDITAHVDFTALAKAGEEKDLKPLLFCTQRELLLALGLRAFVAALDGKNLPAAEYRANRLAMEELVKPDDLGRLKVFVQYKGIEDIPTSAFDLQQLPTLDPKGVDVPLLPGKELY